MILLLICTDPVLRLSVDPDLVAVDKGMMAELICRVDCFCQNVTPSWTRPGSAPFPNQAMVCSHSVLVNYSLYLSYLLSTGNQQW